MTPEEIEAERAYALNEYWLSLSIHGNADAQQQLASLLDLSPIRNRQGVAIPPNPDVAVFRLAEWYDDSNSHDILLKLISQLQEWAPHLLALQKMHNCRLDVSISAFRNTDQGGIDFPIEFIRVLAEAEVSLGISIQALFLWEDDGP